jgi:hypothetical protein
VSVAGGGGFDDLGDAEKVKFSQAETAAMLARLDELLNELDGLRAGVDDPDGLISVTLGFDGRLLELRIADAIGHVMTNLELERRLNSLFAAKGCRRDARRPHLGPAPHHRPVSMSFAR